ncbi:hypothetical protein L873DRAFT_1328582 [Choiromyces venosus 120613-1]|uniref:Uncharacterized protein n=1 Tax=Choiromyces venosus 120613-1 TaxID=1336337 RepID=A0A3N4JA83_9PEZI|nr:hypothetical protein L873DRAFT_1328582 [Choiromyces venosus 120613-1]
MTCVAFSRTLIGFLRVPMRGNKLVPGVWYSWFISWLDHSGRVFSFCLILWAWWLRYCYNDDDVLCMYASYALMGVVFISFYFLYPLGSSGEGYLDLAVTYPSIA